MDASAPRSALFAPGSPEEKWLETVLHEAAPRQGGRRTSPSRQTDLPAVTPSSAARQLFSPSLKQTLSPASPAAAAAAVLPPSSVAADADQLDQRSPAVAAAGLQGSQNPTAPAGAPSASTGAPTLSPASPAAAAADTELHAWLEQIAAKKAELSAATAAAAAASKELAALEAAAGIPQTITSTHNPLTITSTHNPLIPEIPAEHKQATPEQAATRPPATTAEHKQTLLATLETAGIHQADITAILESLTDRTTAEHKQAAEHKQTTTEQEAARPPALSIATKTLQNIFKSISAGLTNEKSPPDRDQTAAEHKQSLTSDIPAEHKQVTPKQAAARPPALTAEHKQSTSQTAEPIIAETAELISIRTKTTHISEIPAEHKQTTSTSEIPAEHKQITSTPEIPAEHKQTAFDESDDSVYSWYCSWYSSYRGPLGNHLS